MHTRQTYIPVPTHIFIDIFKQKNPHVIIYMNVLFMWRRAGRYMHNVFSVHAGVIVLI